MIDKTAIIDPSAVIAEDAVIGPNVIIGKNVKIGARTRVIANAYIEFQTLILNLRKSVKIVQFHRLQQLVQNLKTLVIKVKKQKL